MSAKNPFDHMSLGLALAAIFFAAAVLFASFSYVLIKVSPEDGDVLGAYDQAKVLSTVVGQVGPAVLESGTINLGQERCIGSDEFVQVEVTIYFRREGEGTPSLVPLLERARQTRAPGCNFALFSLPLPPTVGPGQWRVEGFSRALNTSEVRYWSSEVFAVVPAK